MAPNVAGTRKVRDEAAAPGAQNVAMGAPDDRLGDFIEALHEFRKHVEQNSDYVGDTFPEEARKIHYGETEARSIYGEATPEEAKELQEEGVDFHRIPWTVKTDA